jgi:hypothetical protein
MRYALIYRELFASDLVRQFTAREVAKFVSVPQALLEALDHIPGDTTTPPPAGAIQIGPVDV